MTGMNPPSPEDSPPKKRWFDPSGPALRPLLLGLLVGALGSLALLLPSGMPLPSFLQPPTSTKPIRPDEPDEDAWPPPQYTSNSRWRYLRVDDDGWSTGPAGTYRELGDLFERAAPSNKEIAIPIFPTVYTPIIEDKLYYDAILKSDIQPGDKVLVIGTGSGADSWVTSLKCQTTVYVVEINPISVVNARVTARIGGFQINAIAADFTQVELPEEFSGFDYVLWNMPFVEANANDEDFRDRNFHDGDDGSIVTKFLERLPDLLKPEGKAIALNYALAERYMTTPGTTTRIDDDVDEVTATTFMLFEIPNPATAAAPKGTESEAQAAGA